MSSRISSARPLSSSWASSRGRSLGSGFAARAPATKARGTRWARRMLYGAATGKLICSYILQDYVYTEQPGRRTKRRGMHGGASGFKRDLTPVQIIAKSKLVWRPLLPGYDTAEIGPWSGLAHWRMVTSPYDDHPPQTSRRSCEPQFLGRECHPCAPRQWGAATPACGAPMREVWKMQDLGRAEVPRVLLGPLGWGLPNTAWL